MKPSLDALEDAATQSTIDLIRLMGSPLSAPPPSAPPDEPRLAIEGARSTAVDLVRRDEHGRATRTTRVSRADATPVDAGQKLDAAEAIDAAMVQLINMIHSVEQAETAKAVEAATAANTTKDVPRETPIEIIPAPKRAARRDAARTTLPAVVEPDWRTAPHRTAAPRARGSVLRSALLAGRRTESAPTRAQRLRAACTASRFGIVLALLGWLASLPSLRAAKPSNFGLLFASTPLFTLSALVCVLAFCSAVRRGRFGDAVAALLAWIVVVRVTVSVITPLPIYTWTYKHLGIIDYIQTHGHTASGSDIYMAWPGAFSALAWFSSLTGVSTLALAQWFAVGIHLLIALGIFALARAAHLSPMAAISAAFLAEIVNWVGQDYLSPQAISFVLALFVLTALVRARESAIAGWLSVPVFAAIVVSHQLTPYWLILIALALGVGKALRPRWLGGVYAVIALGYLALHLRIAGEYGLISGFDPLSNAESNVSTTGSAGHDITGLMVKVPSLLLWGSAAVIGALQYRAFRRARRVERATGVPRTQRPGVPQWVPLVMAFASFSLLAGQSYGGEAIFRVFLYSLPGCVLVLAPFFVSALLSAPSRIGRLRRFAVRWVAIACTLAAAATSLQGYYGGWFTNVVRQDSLTEMKLLLTTLPTDSLIFTMTSGVPERPVGRYVAFAAKQKYFDAPVQLLPGIHPETDTAQDIAHRLERLSGNTAGPVYLVITAEMREYSSYYGVFKPGMLVALPKLLRTDGHWWTISDTSTLQVFRLVGSGE